MPSFDETSPVGSSFDGVSSSVECWDDSPEFSLLSWLPVRVSMIVPRPGRSSLEPDCSREGLFEIERVRGIAFPS